MTAWSVVLKLLVNAMLLLLVKVMLLVLTASEFGFQTDNECCASACNSKSIGFEPFSFSLIVNVALQLLLHCI